MLPSEFVLTNLWKPPVPLQKNTPGFYLAVGPKELPFWALSSLCPALHNGGQVFWVDGANRFDAYGVGRAAQALGLSPHKILSRIQLARPFSAFQMENIISTKLRRLSESIPVILADPLALFYDAELEEEDAHRAFRSFLKNLKDLPMTILALAVKRTPPASREIFSKQMAREAKAMAHLDVTHGPWRLETKRPNKIQTIPAA
jgi:hypothetical protein